MSEGFDFQPAAWIPFRDKAVLERCRNIRREDMEKHPNPDFKIKIVQDVSSLFVADCFTRIRISDEQDRNLVMIFPNPWPSAYANVAEMCNRYRVSCRNVHTFCMDEWADQDGRVAPLTYRAGLGYSFMKYFYSSLDEELRPKVEQIHHFTNENVRDYSDIIDETGGGGADVCYSATGWPGHTAFIDPDTEEFKAETLDEFLTLGSRIVTQHPLTIAENSLFGIFGCSGDVANVPPRAATIGPRDIAHARDHFEMHSLAAPGGYNSWQRMISRLTLYGPVNMQVPASILQLFKTSVYVSEDIARPFGCWETVGY
jgi:glucosamine-6-phosphate deaminase